MFPLSLTLAIMFRLIPGSTIGVETIFPQTKPDQLRSNPQSAAGVEIDEGNRSAHANRWPEAIQAYQRAVELDPSSATAYGNLGHVYGQMGRFQEAVVALQRAISLSPENAVFKYNLGNTLLK